MTALYATHPRSLRVHLCEPSRARTFCGLRITDEWSTGPTTHNGLAADCKRCRENSLTKEPRF